MNIVSESLEELNEDFKSKFTKGLIGAAFVGGLTGSPLQAQSHNYGFDINQEFNKKLGSERSYGFGAIDLSYARYKNLGLPDSSYTHWVINNIKKKGIENINNINTERLSSRIIFSDAIFSDGNSKIKTVLLTHGPITPGDFLIKGKQQILTGLGMQAIGGIVSLISVQSMKNLNIEDFPEIYNNKKVYGSYDMAGV